MTNTTDLDTIDRELAEKAMGWSLDEHNTWLDSSGEMIIPKLVGPLYKFSYWDADVETEQWQPTRYIAQAMMVWDAMLPKTAWLMNSLRFVGEPNGDWCIDGPTVCVYADTRALAICLAAQAWLKAKGDREAGDVE